MQVIRVLALLLAALSLPVSGFGQVLHACASMEAITAAHACCPSEQAQQHVAQAEHDEDCCDTVLVRDLEPVPQVQAAPELPSLVVVAEPTPTGPVIDLREARVEASPRWARGPPGQPPPVYLSTCSLLL